MLDIIILSLFGKMKWHSPLPFQNCAEFYTMLHEYASNIKPEIYHDKKPFMEK